MKKHLFASLLLATFCLSSFKSENPVALQSKTNKTTALFASRGWILDGTGNYTVYVDTPNPTYYGSFGGGNVILSIQNNTTSAFFSPTSQLGSIVSGATGDYLDHAKARFVEDGVTVEIFFSGDLNP